MPTFSTWLANILKVFFKLLYHPFAWSYDLVANIVSVGMWNKWRQSILPDLNGLNILEIGHGPGHLQKELLAPNKIIHGLDLSPQMGRIAFKRLMKLGQHPNLVNGKVQQLPYSSNSFDQIAATFPSEYILSSKTIQEIYRVLKPNGKFIFIPVAWITGKSLVYRIASTLFNITGQSPEIDNTSFTGLIKKYEKQGFLVDSKLIKMKNSELIIFHCCK